MHIEFEKSYKISQKEVSCSLSLEQNCTYLLEGENGIGKSTFFHFLKLNQDHYFQSFSLSFLDQARLIPLNDISFVQCVELLKESRNEDLDLFEEAKNKISSFHHIPLKELSGGQNQMVKIALFLYIGGDIFCMDEPLQHLDKGNIQWFCSLLEKLKQKGKTVLIIEHKNDYLDLYIDKKIQFTHKNDQLFIHHKGESL